MGFWDSMIDTIEQRKGLWSEPKRNKSVERSNMAHNRLLNKHMNDRNYRLMNYHNRVAHEQWEQNRVLTKAERKKIFRSTRD